MNIRADTAVAEWATYSREWLTDIYPQDFYPREYLLSGYLPIDF